MIHAINYVARHGTLVPRCLGLGGEANSFATNWGDVSCWSCLQTRPPGSSSRVDECGDITSLGRPLAGGAP